MQQLLLVGLEDHQARKFAGLSGGIDSQYVFPSRRRAGILLKYLCERSVEFTGEGDDLLLRESLRSSFDGRPKPLKLIFDSAASRLRNGWVSGP